MALRDLEFLIGHQRGLQRGVGVGGISRYGDGDDQDDGAGHEHEGQGVCWHAVGERKVALQLVLGRELPENVPAHAVKPGRGQL